MKTFEEYGNSFRTIAMRRVDGILEMRLHSDGGPFQWSLVAHDELEEAFLLVSRDHANEVVLLTGTGDIFSGPEVPAGASRERKISHDEFEEIGRIGRRLIINCLEIPVPVIAAINGPARRHPELPLLADIVLMAENALIQDSAHFRGGMVPGDGVHVVFPHLMGPLRASYFLMTAQEIDARMALAIGLANEVVPADQLEPRTWELARALLSQPREVRHQTRMLMTQELKVKVQKMLGYGFVAERIGHAGAHS